MKKPVKILLIVSAVLVCTVLFLTLARPLIRVTKESDETGKVKWNVTATGLSFREFYLTTPWQVEKLENGEWKACSFNPGMENVKDGLHLWCLNYPGMTRRIQTDFGFVFDLSEPGKYRVVVNVGKDDRFVNSYTVSREFSVK